MTQMSEHFLFPRVCLHWSYKGKNLYEMKYQEFTQILGSKHFLQHLVLVGGRWFLVNPGPILSTFTCST